MYHVSIPLAKGSKRTLLLRIERGFFLFDLTECIHEHLRHSQLRSLVDAILPPKGIGQNTPRRLGQRCKRRPKGSHEPQGRFQAYGLSMNPLIFVHIRLRFHYFWALYLGLHNVGRVPQTCRIFQPLYLGHLDYSFCISDNFVISHALSEYLMCVLGNKFN